MIKKYFSNNLLTVFSALLISINTYSSSVEIQEKTGNFLSNDVVLIDENGKPTPISQLVDKPTVISFVYFNCPGVCTPIMNEIQHIIETSELKIGVDYQFLTIGFDHLETHELAKKKKANYLNSMSNKTATELGWRFLTGDSLNIAKAANSLGFRFKKVGTEYLHKACMIILNKEGKIIRYSHGVKLLPVELNLSVIEGAKGNTLPRINKKNEYCFPYVAPAYERLNSIAKRYGIITIILALSLLFFLIYKPRLRS